MVKDSNDPDSLSVQIIEDSMATVGQALDRRLNVSTQRAGLRMAAEQVEGRFEAPEIVLADLPAEPFDTEV